MAQQDPGRTEESQRWRHLAAFGWGCGPAEKGTVLRHDRSAGACPRSSSGWRRRNVFRCLRFRLLESESWLIAAAPGMRALPDGRELTLPPQLPSNPEIAPRAAKAWLNDVLSGGYRETLDQSVLTKAIDLQFLRTANLRSFRRLENAVAQLVSAMRTGRHIASPVTGD